MEPADWVVTHTPLIKAGGTILDLACGRGRHTRYMLEQGFRVMAVDLNLEGMGDLLIHPSLAVLGADLEEGNWPLGNAEFDGIIVTNYLHRPLFPYILSALSPDGVLIYETFMDGNAEHGRPTNPDFLLQSDELPDICKRLEIHAFKQGFEENPKPAMKQKIVAINRN